MPYTPPPDEVQGYIPPPDEVAEGASTLPTFDTSMDVGVGTNKPMASPLQQRLAILKGYTPLGPAGVGGMAYRAITGKKPPEWVPEPTAEGFTKGLSNLVTGPMRLQANLGQRLGDVTGIEFLKQKYGIEADVAGKLAQDIEQIYRQQAQPSKTGEMLGESVPFLAMGPTSLGASIAPKLPSILRPVARLGLGAAEGYGVSQAVNPQAQAQTRAEYEQAQAETGKMGAFLGGGGALAAELASPLARILKRGKPKVEAAGLQKDLSARMGGEEESDVFQTELKKAFLADLAEARKPFEALRARDVTKTPEVELHGGQTSFKGKRLSNLLGPNDDVIVAKTPQGEEVGYLWLTKEPDGFTIRKVEVDPKFHRQGIATYMNNEAEKAFGPYRGATDYTPEGKAFRESIGKQKGEIALGGFTAKVGQLQQELKDLGADEADPVLKELGGFAERIGRSKEKGWTRALDVSKRLNDAITQAKTSKDNYRAMMLIKAKDALEENLAKFPEYMEAKSLWKEKMAPWEGKEEGGTFLKRAMESPTPDVEIAKVIKAKPDQAQIFYDRLSDKGKDAVKSAYMQELLKNSEGDPLKIAKALSEAKKAGSVEVFFKGEDKARLDGLEKLMKYAHRTGITVGVSGGAAGASMAGPYAPLFGAWIGKKYLAHPISKVAGRMYETDAMQKLLLDASKLGDDSPELARLLEQLPKIVSTGTESEPSEKLKKLLGM